MQVGQTSTGETINFDDSPFDTALIKIPSLGIVWDMTKDMGSGNALTMQPTGTANMTNSADWEGNSHFNHSNAHPGQGNVIVLRGSNTAKLMNKLYNAINPMGTDQQHKSEVVKHNAPFAYFSVEYKNTNSEDKNRTAHDYAIAEGCYFNNPSALQVSEGSNNAQNSETWTYLATTVYKTEGEPVDDSAHGQSTAGLENIESTGKTPAP